MVQTQWDVLGVHNAQIAPRPQGEKFSRRYLMCMHIFFLTQLSQRCKLISMDAIFDLPGCERMNQ
jgi:hypothetical protein